MGLEHDAEAALRLLETPASALNKEGTFCKIYHLRPRLMLKEYAVYDDACSHPQRDIYGNAEWEFVLSSFLRSNKVQVPDIHAIVAVPKKHGSRVGVIMDRFNGFSYYDIRPGSRLAEEYWRQRKRISKLGVDVYDSEKDWNVLYGVDGRSILLHDLVRWEVPMERFEELKREHLPLLYTGLGGIVYSTSPARAAHAEQELE